MAVYTEVSEDELDASSPSYDARRRCSRTRASPKASRTPTIWCTRRGGTFILTLYEKRVDPADLPFFLGLMEHLAAARHATVRCRCTTRRHACSARSPAGRRRSSPSSKACGCGGPTAAHAGSSARRSAELHIAGDGFSAEARQCAVGRRLAAAVREAVVRARRRDRAGPRDQIAAELRYLERTWPKDLPPGVIHADLFPDNVFFLDDKLSGLIDFYFACNDALAYDIAICLNAWCFETRNRFEPPRARRLSPATSSVRPLERCRARGAAGAGARRGAALPADAAATTGSTRRRTRWSAARIPLEYVRELRFHRRVGVIADYGLG